MVSNLGLNILGHFCYPSGLRESALAIVEGLRRAGVQTSCRDVAVPGVKPEANNAEFASEEVHPITLIHVQPEPFFEAIEESSGLKLRDDRYRIAYWYWESDRVPSHWPGIIERMGVREVWTASHFSAEAMRAGLQVPVFHLRPGLALPPFEPLSRFSLGIPESVFIFLFVFDMRSAMERKNPAAVIRAFREAFGPEEPVRLVIRARHGSQDAPMLASLYREAREAGGVLIMERPLSRDTAYALTLACDCYVSLHRSEGLGLTIAEAMLMGKPVIATAYSGNMDFMNAESSYLVDFKLTQTKVEMVPYPAGTVWADASITSASALMRHVYENKDEARARGQKGQQDVAGALSLDVAGRRMRASLEEIHGRHHVRG